MKKTQKGAVSAELIGVLIAIAVILLFVVSQSPKIWDSIREIHFSYQTNEVVQGVNRWKRGRANFTGVNLAAVCATGDLSKSVCGSGNNGQGTNSYGGNWSVAVNTGSAGLFDVTATLPEDGDKIAALADSIAPTTRADCDQAAGCSTISASANSIKMTF